MRLWSGKTFSHSLARVMCFCLLSLRTCVVIRVKSHVLPSHRAVNMTVHNCGLPVQHSWPTHRSHANVTARWLPIHRGGSEGENLRQLINCQWIFKIRHGRTGTKVQGRCNAFSFTHTEEAAWSMLKKQQVLKGREEEKKRVILALVSQRLRCRGVETDPANSNVTRNKRYQQEWERLRQIGGTTPGDRRDHEHPLAPAERLIVCCCFPTVVSDLKA